MFKKISLLLVLIFVCACSNNSKISKEVKELNIDSTNKYAIQDADKAPKKRLEDIIVFNEEGVSIRREGKNLILSMPELILFDFDKYDIKARIKPSLQTLAKALGS